MSLIRRTMSAALSFGLSACAIHPLPENVTGVNTAAIVHRIRCEARDAVVQAASELSSPAKVQALGTIGIVYSFSLEGMETDGVATASATFSQQLTNVTRSLNPTLGDTVMRQNVRAFTVSDSFQSLIQMNQKKCESEPSGPNYQYPVVGTIGIAEMIRTFINMSMHESIGPPEGTVTQVDASANGPPTMVDSITFTTTLSAGLTPTITLTPVTSALQLTNATLTASLMRQDIHQVIVGLGLPTEQSSKHAFPRSAYPLFGMLVSASPSSSGEVAALQAVNNQILRFEVPRPLIVTP